MCDGASVFEHTAQHGQRLVISAQPLNSTTCENQSRSELSVRALQLYYANF